MCVAECKGERPIYLMRGQVPFHKTALNIENPAKTDFHRSVNDHLIQVTTNTTKSQSSIKCMPQIIC